jgi:hypothetical protein
MALNALPVYCFNVSQFANNILSQVGPGRYCSPRHTMPAHSSNAWMMKACE